MRDNGKAISLIGVIALVFLLLMGDAAPFEATALAVLAVCIGLIMVGMGKS